MGESEGRGGGVDQLKVMRDKTCGEIQNRKKDRNVEQSPQPAAPTARFKIRARRRPQGSLLKLMNLTTQWRLSKLECPPSTMMKRKKKKKRNRRLEPHAVRAAAPPAGHFAHQTRGKNVVKFLFCQSKPTAESTSCESNGRVSHCSAALEASSEEPSVGGV